nr:AsmA-like C-terminal domain-containing protein [Candidatus Omnitrophota bacterium]
MRKIFITIAIILGLLVIGMAVFALTFDANRYKAALITKLEESMDRDVMIESVSVNLLSGLVLEAKGVAIKDRLKSWSDFLLKADRFNVNLEILPLLKKDIQVKRLVIPVLEINAGSGAASPVFRCAVDIKVRVLINSLSQDDMLKTLNAKGNVKLTNAVLSNMNVLKTVLDSLSMLPNVVRKLKDNLPENYKGLLNQDYTAFKPMKSDFEIKDGRIYFDNLLVESDTFYLVSKGSVGIIDQSLRISSNLFIPKDLSGAFSNVVPEFKYLTDNDGLITMPLEIKGKMPSVSVAPDLNYILQKLIASKGQEFLNRIFKGR